MESRARLSVFIFAHHSCGCVTSDKLLNLSERQYSHLENDNNNRTHLIKDAVKIKEGVTYNAIGT